MMSKVMWFILFLYVVKICCSKIPILEIDRYRAGDVSYKPRKEFLLNDQPLQNVSVNENYTNETTENKTISDFEDYETETEENVIAENIFVEEVAPNRNLEDLEHLLDIKLLNGVLMRFPQKITPPQFMTDLYQSITNSKDGHKLHGASIIRALLEQDPSSQGIFLFSLNGIEDDEEIAEAELHVYRTGLEKQDANIHSPYYLLRVYQIMPMPRYEYSLNPDVHQLLNVHYISAFSLGWQVFKVKRAVESWRNKTFPNLGLLITATTIFGEPVEVRFARRGLHSDIFQPSLTVFATRKEDNKKGKPKNHSIHKRSINPTSVIQYYDSNATCQKRSLYVDFEKFGWDDWIIAPKGYDAYSCSGSCGALKGQNDSSMITKHGFIQNLIKRRFYNDLTELSCVPVEFSNLEILYMGPNDDYVTLKKFENMIVKRCACR